MTLWKYTDEYYALSEKTLDVALEKVAMYYQWKLLDPGQGYDIDNRYIALPVTTKKDIRENFPNGISPFDYDINHGINTGEISLVETSGTTDDKVINVWNQKWWDASEKSSWKLNSYMSRVATGSHKEAILVNPKNVGIVSDNVDLPLEKRRLSRFLYLNEKTDPLTWTSALMERMVQELNTYQPDVLEANPSYLARLCRYVADRRETVFQPGVIVFTYEYPAFFHYRKINKVFPRVPIVSSYGTTETGYVFMQCEKGKFHQNCDYCRVDFQPFKKEHGGPLLGRILVTPLRNSWNYLIRFDTGDIVQLEVSGQCDCGRDTGLILSSINGRRANLTLTCDGRLVTLSELDDALSIAEDIEEYKLIQTNIASYEVHLVSRQVVPEMVSSEITSILKNLYGQKARISIIFEKDIAPENSGKYMFSKALFPIPLEEYLEVMQ